MMKSGNTKDPAATPDPLARPAALDLRSIRYLVAIVEEGSLAAAARRLDVTQPALSRSIQAHEKLLGVRLLDRGKQGAVPTAAGRLLVEKGRVLLDDMQALLREVDLHRGADRGEITIGAGAYPADICLGPALARLLALKPSLHVRVTTGDWPNLTQGVLSGALDIAVCELAGALGDPRLVVESLPKHQGWLFCRPGHPLAKETVVNMEAIRSFPLALTALPPRLVALLRKDPQGGEDLAAPPVHVETFQLARRIVLGSDVIGAGTAPQLDDDLREGRLTLLPLELPWLTTDYGFVHRAGRTLAPSLRLFMEQVREVEAGFAAQASPRDAAASGKRGGSAGAAPSKRRPPSSAV